MGVGRTMQWYRNNPEGYKKKMKRDYENPVWGAKTKGRSKRRVDSAKKRREAKRKGINISGKDYDHKQGRFISSKANRGQKEKSRIVGSKRNAFGRTLSNVLTKKK